MFGLSKKRSYLGVDFGSAGLKAVELGVEKGKPRLITYGLTEMPVDIVRNVSPEARDQAVASLKALLAAAHVTTTKAVAALPNYAVFTQIIDLPAMADKDIAAAVRWEAKKIVPWPLEEMILDWKILNKKKLSVKGGGPFGQKKPSQPLAENLSADKEKNNSAELEKNGTDKKEDDIVRPTSKPDENYRILLTAAPKNLVARYIDIFKRAKFNLLSLETEAFAMARSLLGNDLSTVMIVDIGATTADICIIEDGVPVLNRGIDTGGEFITKTVMNSLNVNQDRAEQFKRDFGLSSSGGNQHIPDVIQKSLNSIINEIKYVFELYQRQENKGIEKIILTGGSSFLPNLPQYLSELLNMQVIIGDPWDRVVYPLDLKPVLEEIGPRMSISIGLAMRDIF